MSIHNPFGPYNAALLATPPSPLKLEEPVPAYVLIIPVTTVILRTRLLIKSLKYTFPLESIAMPAGPFTDALVAWSLSPE